MIAAPIAVKAAVLIAALVPLIVEAALRALLAAVAVWAGLRLLRVSNVLVQKAAWGLVLIAALALPLLPHGRALPAFAALRMPVFPLLSVPSSQAVVAAAPTPASPTIKTPAETALVEDVSLPTPSRHASAHAKLATRQIAVPPQDTERIFAPTVTNSRFGSTEVELPIRPESNPEPFTAQPVSVVKPAIASQQPAPFRIATAAWILYFSVFAALLLRLLIGLVSAFRLWMSAEPVLAPEVADTIGNTPLRFSLRVASPINIGSGILLPPDYAEWDEQKLRVVLAHERSHIRQGDFYLQLLAGLYASFFWFSPLGWWLKRKLSELGEAISDRAGLEEATSRSSYAQLLLEFAALPRPTLTGVAMARKSHLTQRIERLLNESSFRQAFAAGGRRTLLAFLLVPVALFAATAMVRVEAAASPLAQVAPQAQVTGQSTPEQVTEPAPAPAPAPMPDGAPMPPPPGSMQTPPPPPPMDAAGPGPGPMQPQSPMHVEVPPVHVDMAPMPPMPPIHVQIPHDAVHVHIDPSMRAEMDAAREEARMYRSFGHGDHGDPYALVGDPGSKNRIHGEWDSGRNEEIEKARKVTHGHFLWFRHDGKSYVVDDPAIVAQVEAMEKPMDDLGQQMRALGDQMRAMGEKQRAEGQKLRDLAIPTPDLSKQLAELTAAAESLKAKQGGTISQKDIGELQREIGRIQGDLGALQGKLISQQMNLNGGMGKFGGQMGELGGQMGQLGGKMGKLGQENREKMKSIIDDSLKSGKAKPVE